MSAPDVRLGASRLTGPYTVREVCYAPGLLQPRHTHSGWSVTLVVSGDIRETAGSREAFGSALSVSVKPPGVEHADEFGPRGARTLQVAGPGGGGHARPDGPVAPGPWRWRNGGAEVRPLLSLLRLLRGPERDPGLDDLEGRVFEMLAATTPDPGRGPGTGDPPGWLRRAREAADDLALDGFRVRDLAEEAGVHPVSLARAFRRHYGCSPTEHRARVRLRHAARAIADGGGSLSRVAFGSGYADQPHLCRQFREATGMTPSAFRRLSRTSV